MRDPAFLFYSSDFMTGTSFMNYRQKGEYITLLCLQHQHGHLTMEQIESVTKNEKVKFKFVLAPDGKYHNLRLHNEVMKRQKFCEHQRENIKKRWNKKNIPNIYHGITTVIPLEDEDENINIIKDIKKDKKEGMQGDKQNIPPSFDEVQKYITENNYNVDSQKFINFYESKGWMIGKNKMKSWQAAVRTWNKPKEEDSWTKAEREIKEQWKKEEKLK